MAFKPVVVHKDGKQDRVARTPVELVQFKHEGYVEVREAAKTVAESGASVPQTSKKKSDTTDDTPSS